MLTAGVGSVLMMLNFQDTGYLYGLCGGVQPPKSRQAQALRKYGLAQGNALAQPGHILLSLRQQHQKAEEIARC